MSCLICLRALSLFSYPVISVEDNPDTCKVICLIVLGAVDVPGLFSQQFADEFGNTIHLRWGIEAQMSGWGRLAVAFMILMMEVRASGMSLLPLARFGGRLTGSEEKS